MKINIPRSSARPDWLIIFFILESVDFRKEMTKFYSDLKDTKLKETTKVYLIIDSVKKIKNTNKYAFPLRLFEFVFDPVAGQTKKVPIPLRGIDRTDGHAWKKLISELYDQVNATYNSLVTWSHGSGLGVVSDASNMPRVEHRPYNFIRNYKSRPLQFPADRISHSAVTPFDNVIAIEPRHDAECQAIEELFITEIGDAMEKVTKTRKIDIVVMCNCNTHILDNPYNLSRITDYYLAPLTTVYLNGYDFANFVRYVNDNPGPASKSLGWLLPGRRSIFRRRNTKDLLRKPYIRNIVTQLFEGYKRSSPKTWEGEVLAANRLVEMWKLPGLFNPICAYLLAHQKDTYPALLAVITQDIQSIPSSRLFDVVTMFKALARRLQSDELTALVERFESFVNEKVLLDNMIGPKVSGRGIHCFTVYMPRDKNIKVPAVIECFYMRDYLKTPFVADTNWDKFISSFIYWRTASP